jgi:hypothetical protein
LGRAAGQAVPNRAASYLFPTDVHDARGVWVNPGAGGLDRNASIYLELNVGDPGSKGRLRQIDAGFLSRGLSFAYQRDNLDNGVHGSTYRLGLSGGSAGIAGGVAVARYEGFTHSTGWDAGLSYIAHPSLTLAVVVANIGQPIVRGDLLRVLFTPGVTWRPGPIPGLALSSYARFSADSLARRYVFGVSWQTGGGDPSARWPIGVLARLDTDGHVRRAGFAFGLSIGSRDRIGAVVSTPGDVSRISEASAYGVSTREAPAGRR